MAHRVWATGEEGGSFTVGTDAEDQAFIEVAGTPVVVSALGGTVHYAEGLDAATLESPTFTRKAFGAGTWSFLADAAGA